MERLKELTGRRVQLVHWIDEVFDILESNQPYIPEVGQAVVVAMRSEIVRIDLEILDIHEAEYETLKRDILRLCVSPRSLNSHLEDDEIPF